MKRMDMRTLLLITEFTARNKKYVKNDTTWTLQMKQFLESKKRYSEEDLQDLEEILDLKEQAMNELRETIAQYKKVYQMGEHR
jgi:hypothetical protein